MKILLKVFVVGLVLTLSACKESVSLNKNHPINTFLEQNQPLLKSLRDSAAYQVLELDNNINDLKKLSRSFNDVDSKNMVYQKLDMLEFQRNRLFDQIKRIDAEAEKGIALHKINQIDGGGTASVSYSELINETQRRIATAKQINTNTNREYKTGVQISDDNNPPKAIVVHH